MKEYIERAAVLNKTQEIYHWAGYESRYDEFVSCEDIRNIPAAEVVEVRHAKWKYFHKQNKAVCTNCSFERDLDADFGRAIACPNCGARMGKEDEQ